MSEYSIGYQTVGGLVGVVLACLCYMMGGRSNKWIRRFIGSFILTVTVNVLCALQGNWSPWMLTLYPCLVLAFSMGYGGTDDVGEKIARRSVYAAGVLMSGVIMCLILGSKAWWVFIPHAGVGAWSVYLGVRNPIPAAAEEVFVCLSLTAFLVAYPFIGGA